MSPSTNTTPTEHAAYARPASTGVRVSWFAARMVARQQKGSFKLRPRVTPPETAVSDVSTLCDRRSTQHEGSRRTRATHAIRDIGSCKLKLGVEKPGAGSLITVIGARGHDWPSRGGGRRSRFSGSRKSRRLQMFAGTDVPARVERVVSAPRWTSAETAGNVRFKRTCKRRDAIVRMETASVGPSPAQLTELRLLYTMSRSRGFPRRRTGSRNRRFRAVFAGIARDASNG